MLLILFPKQVVCDTAKVRFFKQITTGVILYWKCPCCLRYCKSTIFQANHNASDTCQRMVKVVCDTAKVRFFKQITTPLPLVLLAVLLFAILQKYDFSSKSQPEDENNSIIIVVCDTAKVRFFKQITTILARVLARYQLFAILQKYDFSSKSQPSSTRKVMAARCLRYCKSTIFQANHNNIIDNNAMYDVVCDTAKVRFFKQITTAKRK